MQTDLHDALLGRADDLSALARCLAREDADDLVQDTWVAALQARHGPRSAATWLRQVMRNEFRLRLRARMRRRARERRWPTEAHAPGPDAIAEHAELQAAILEAVDDLDEPYGDVIRRRFLHGRTPTEIAAEIGSPPATIRWQIHEALRRVRLRLDARYGERRHWHGGALAIGLVPMGRAERTTIAMTMTTRWMMVKWLAGLSTAAAAVGLAVVQWPAPAAARAGRDAVPVDEEAPSRPVAPREHAERSAPAAATTAAPEMDRDESPELPCSGDCADPEQPRPMRVVASNDDELKAAFAACEHLVPSGAGPGRFEIEVTVRGGSDDVGNTITGVSVTRGRKMPCIDPDATFDAPDGPDVVHFPAVQECVEHSLSPAFTTALAEGESHAVGAVIGDPTRDAAVATPLPEPSKAARSIDPEQAVAQLGLAGTGDPTRAKVSIVECGGYDCSFCNRARVAMEELHDRYGDAVSLHFLQMPLPMHPTGALAARAAVAAGLQGELWAMHEALFDDPTLRSEAALVERARALGLDADRFARDLADPATAQAVADQREVCQAAGAHGTPSFFINGDLLVGSQAIEAFTAIIDDELAEP